MTKVIDKLNNSQSAFASFELVPPLKGSDVNVLYKSIEPLIDLNPAFINVTCHRDEVQYIPNDNGTFNKLTLSKRPSTLAIVAAIMQRFDVDIVPHVICGGASMAKIESELLDLHFMGINNVVALRGDAEPGQKRFIPDPDGFMHSNELVSMISRLNNGEYLDPRISGVSTDFCVGVAGYPEKHYEAPNLESDIMHLKRKVDAGAHYVVSQMFFDNQKFYDFSNRCREAGITGPIIPGLKPLSTAKQLQTIPQAFHLDIPNELVTELMRHDSKDAQYEVGIEWCIAQCLDLLEHDVPALHFYTMGRADNVRRIVKAVL